MTEIILGIIALAVLIVGNFVISLKRPGTSVPSKEAAGPMSRAGEVSAQEQSRSTSQFSGRHTIKWMKLSALKHSRTV